MEHDRVQEQEESTMNNTHYAFRSRTLSQLRPKVRRFVGLPLPTFFVLITMALVFASCSATPNVSDVTEKVEKQVNSVKSYQSEGTMTVYTSKTPQTYDVSVHFEQPHFYRIALTNRTKNITQIILRNNDGVFVLTPHLQKSFRFQSDWPNKQGQAYLYETLMQAILSDTNAQLLTEPSTYVFDVAANYNNGSLVRQKIWLDRQTLMPTQVVVSNTNAQDIIRVTFKTFQLNPKTQRTMFDMQHNMTRLSLQAIPLVDENTAATHTATAPPSSPPTLNLIVPTYVPAGVTAHTPLPHEDTVILRYTGKYNYTLTQRLATKTNVSTHQIGTVADVLDDSVGVLLGEKQRSLLWTADGQDYQLVSNTLPYEEMLHIAHSMTMSIDK
jgi:outer membrane lipoprotein-sorting protein